MGRATGRLRRILGSLPWLTRYPLWRAAELCRRAAETGCPQHVVMVVANHFEPGWTESGVIPDWSAQRERLDAWSRDARAIGQRIHDCEGVPFRHTYFYPAEQYHPLLLDGLAELQAQGAGEVEVHLHHGVEEPDTEANLRRVLLGFRDTIAHEHGCLSRWEGGGAPMYGFLHGNWALGNSHGGRYCGVDSELQVLAETGCYADFTLPSAPDPSQVAPINRIYECGRPLQERRPHRTGRDVRSGRAPALPILITGPLVFDWRRRGPLPSLDTGDLTASFPLDRRRFDLWRSARIGVRGRPDWVFLKLHCHGFFPGEQERTVGATMARFLEEVLDAGDRSGAYRVYFATAREAFNMVMAAADGHGGAPGAYRDYRLRPIRAGACPPRERSERDRALGRAGGPGGPGS